MTKERNDLFTEPSTIYSTTKMSDEDRLRRDVYRSDMDKLKMFTKMLRTNRILNKAEITHK
jgi:hypothetical protein